MATVWRLTDGVTTITFDYMVSWDQAQPPIERRIACLGRNWERVHHDGAKALEVYLSAVLEGTPAALEVQVAQLRIWMKLGTSLTIQAVGEAYYNGLTKMKLSSLRAPRMVAYLNHRDLQITLVRKEE